MYILNSAIKELESLISFVIDVITQRSLCLLSIIL